MLLLIIINLLKLVLLYKASSHGDNIWSFHSRCDKKGPTITFFTHNSTGYRLGGFTNYCWKNEDYYNDPNTFLFSLNYKKKFNTKNPNGYYAVYLGKSYGPYFGGTDI